MGALVSLKERQLSVVPGSVASLTVTVKNTGGVVDQFAIDVLGDPGAFASSAPPSLSLFPGTEGTAVVTFSPQRAASTPSGALPFAIRARSQEDPGGSAVEEGVLEVGTYTDTFAELVPRTSRGSRSASHELAVDNRGNAHLNANITAADPDQWLAFDVEPPGLVVDPGTAAFAKVRVKATKRFWRGPAKTRPFKIAVAGESGPAAVLDGSMLQEAMLPRWLIPALLGLLALLALGLIAWLTLLQPAIKGAALAALEDAGFTPIPSAERSAAASAASSAKAKPSAAAPSVPGGPSASAGGGASPSPSASADNGGTASPSVSPTVSATSSGGSGTGGIPVGTPRDGRLSGDGKNDSVATFDKTFYLTDLVFANPNARNGTLELRRGSLVLITLRLENFRDLDFHYVTPIVVQPTQKLTLVVGCNPTTPCEPSVYYSGFLAP